MTQFARMLPTLLTRTDVVLELRDARLPLTSINHTFEGTSAHARFLFCHEYWCISFSSKNQCNRTEVT